MNTREAAATAAVTAATIRHWARMGAVAATKTRGRWVIDHASLAHRIALTAKPAARKAFTVENIQAIGGNRWQRGDMDRVYLNNWADYAGIEIARYNTGNISGAWIDGRAVANSRIHGILGTVSKVYFDTADGLLHVQHHGARNIEVRYLDGRREEFDLVDAIFAGVRAAVNAL